MYSIRRYIIQIMHIFVFSG